MKKLILITLLFAACKPDNHNGFYYKHAESQYSIADDTLEIQDDHIIDHVGFQRIRNGKLLTKEFKTEELYELHPRYGKNYLIVKTFQYNKIN